MPLVDRATEANSRTFRLKSEPSYTITLMCGNLFRMSKADRTFVLDILDTLEQYEAAPEVDHADA